jgi:cell division transport system permease protein
MESLLKKVFTKNAKNMKTTVNSSFTYIRRSPFQALAAISVLAVTYFVVTFVAVAIFSVSRTLNYFETRPQAIAFIKSDASEESVNGLKQKLSGDSRIKSVKLVSREEAYAIYKDATKDNPLLGELVSPSIFPPSLEFTVTDLSNAQEILDSVKQDPIIETVGFTASLGGADTVNSVISRLQQVGRSLRIVGISAVTVLLTTSFLVLLVVMSMRVTMRKPEIESLRFLGASSGFIRLPLMIEAMVYSIVGVAIGWIAATLLTMYIAPSVFRYVGDIPILPRAMGEFFTLFGIVLLIDILSAVIIALLGSVVAVSRSLRGK